MQLQTHLDPLEWILEGFRLVGDHLVWNESMNTIIKSHFNTDRNTRTATLPGILNNVHEFCAY